MESLQQFAKNVWIADGPSVPAFGFAFPSRMIVVRLREGSVWINSPVACTPAQMQTVAAIGPVKYLISPTPLHDWRLEAWAKAFPDAQCWRTRSGAPFLLANEPPAAWAADLDQLLFKGSRVLDEAYFLHRESRTLIFGDFIQQYSARPGKPLFNLFTKLAGLRNGGVPPDIRMSFIGNKTEARRSLERLLSWDFERFIPAHGDCLECGAKPYVRGAFDWLGLPS